MVYVCSICGHIYDEAKEEVPFAQLPDDCDLLLNPRLEESPSTKEVRT